jgi:aryl-alcohol dehydrogenase-like predicted oxidoreductase
LEIITKVGFSSNFKKINFNEKEIKNSLENSINRLKSDYVDVLLMHSPGVEVLKNDYLSIKNIMEDLRAKKKIKEWGISLKSPEELKYIDINNFPKYIQLNYNL